MHLRFLKRRERWLRKDPLLRLQNPPNNTTRIPPSSHKAAVELQPGILGNKNHPWGGAEASNMQGKRQAAVIPMEMTAGKRLSRKTREIRSSETSGRVTLCTWDQCSAPTWMGYRTEVYFLVSSLSFDILLPQPFVWQKPCTKRLVSVKRSRDRDHTLIAA